MRTRIVLLLFVAALVIGVYAGGASASGPAAPGKNLVTLNCGGGVGTVTVSVQRGRNSNGAGQIVGRKGHGIPVSFTSTVTDVTTHTVLHTDSHAVGKGHAHRNQVTTHCSGVVFDAPASVFFAPGPLPAGVHATDDIQVSIDVEVIIKL